jgi:hypothetical protein
MPVGGCPVDLDPRNRGGMNGSEIAVLVALIVVIVIAVGAQRRRK